MIRPLLFGGTSVALHLGALVMLLPPDRGTQAQVAQELSLPIAFLAETVPEAAQADAQEAAQPLAAETFVTDAPEEALPEPAPAVEAPDVTDAEEAAEFAEPPEVMAAPLVSDTAEATETAEVPEVAMAPETVEDTVETQEIGPALAALPLAPVPPARPSNLRTERASAQSTAPTTTAGTAHAGAPRTNAGAAGAGARPRWPNGIARAPPRRHTPMRRLRPPAPRKPPMPIAAMCRRRTKAP